MARQIADALEQAWASFLNNLAQFVPKAIAALSLVLVGWIIAAAARIIVRYVLRWVRVNQLADRSGLSELLRTAQLPPLDVFVGQVVFWLVWIGFLLSGIDALQFRSLEGIVEAFLAFIPRLIVALVILVAGIVVANFAWRATLLAAVNAGLPSARLISAGVRILIIAMVLAMALEHVTVARTVVFTAFAIAFGAVMLGLALAFGLGGRDAARRLLEEQLASRRPREQDDIAHL